MNLVLLEPEDFVAADRARIAGRRLQHVRRVLGKGVGDSIRIGRLDDRIGEATILAIESGAAELACTFDRDPPAKIRVTLVLALPRPPMLRRILQHATAMGVPRIVLVHAARVEKSFWDAHDLRDDAIAKHVRLGLEQAGDTVLPCVELQRRFRPFVEDELPRLGESAHRIVAQAADIASDPPGPGDVVLCIGPEGGWVDFELQLFAAGGCAAFSLGPRVLRVETAVVAALARLG